jgi:DNA modification methylase
MKLGTAHVIRGNALAIPLADESVDIIITSPPYFALRSYQDGGEHYEGQIGSEPTPHEFVDALVAATRECVRVLRPAGSLWVNLGDKYAGDGRGTRPQGATGGRATRKSAQQYVTHSEQRADIEMPYKSLMKLADRYVIRCIDELGLILRAEVIWDKPNGTPESITDRPRRSHEQWFMLTRQPRYFSAIDEIREPYDGSTARKYVGSLGDPGQAKAQLSKNTDYKTDAYAPNPLGKLPGSVWTVPSEPLLIPDRIAHARCCAGVRRAECEDGLDHFAAFPSEWPKRILKGFGPTHGVCTVCGQGRRPLATALRTLDGEPIGQGEGSLFGDEKTVTRNKGIGNWRFATERRINSYVCACNEPIPTPTGKDAGAKDDSQTTGRAGFNRPRDPEGGPRVISRWEQQHEAGQLRAAHVVHRQTMIEEAGAQAFRHYERVDRAGARAIPEPLRALWRSRGWLVPAPPFEPPPTRPGVVLDPFGGTGTTAMVAKALGMAGISLDLSADYCFLATWRTNDRDQLAKVLNIPKAPSAGGHEHDDDLFTLLEEEGTA